MKIYGKGNENTVTTCVSVSKQEYSQVSERRVSITDIHVSKCVYKTECNKERQ